MHVPSDIRRHAARANLYQGPKGPWLEHLVEDEGLSLEDASKVLHEWEAIPYHDPVQGHMATLMKRNREVHFAAYRRFRGKAGMTPERIRAFLQPILDKEVFLVTKIDNPADARMIEHLGFQKLSVAQGGIQCYILNEIKYPRRKQ
jgi:hypothetical protein